MLHQVNYNALDSAKNAFIAASKKTLNFAKKYGFVPGKKLGASANVFSLNLSSFLKDKKLFLTHLSEGLGTADEAKPDDLTPEEALEFYEIIGRKTVAVMTNDAAATGMQPILLSLYLPSSTPEKVFTEEFMKGFLKGFVEGCRQVGCVYFSGETPELRSKIKEGKLDIAGALFGIMPARTKPIDGSKLKAGDLMIFVQSTGPNENGFTALRDLAEKLPQGYRTKLPSGTQYWRAIQNRSILYTPFIQELLKKGIQPTNIEPITGHGWQKIMRSQKPLRYVIERMLPVPEIFKYVEKQSGASPTEMIKIFNYGLGMVVFVKDEITAKKVIQIAKQKKLNSLIGGYVEKSKQREVLVKPFNTVLRGEEFLLKQ